MQYLIEKKQIAKISKNNRDCLGSSNANERRLNYIREKFWISNSAKGSYSEREVGVISCQRNEKNFNEKE